MSIAAGCRQGCAPSLLGGPRTTDGADGSLATRGVAGGLLGASLGGTLSQPSHLGARSLASRHGRHRRAGGCCARRLALDAVSGAPSESEDDPLALRAVCHALTTAASGRWMALRTWPIASTTR